MVGYFTWRTDTRALWETEDAYLDVRDGRNGAGFDYWAKCITLYPSSGAAGRLSDRLVRVTGTVTIIGDDDIRSFWTCNRVALENAVIRPR